MTGIRELFYMMLQYVEIYNIVWSICLVCVTLSIIVKCIRCLCVATKTRHTELCAKSRYRLIDAEKEQKKNTSSRTAQFAREYRQQTYTKQDKHTKHVCITVNELNQLI